MYHITKWKFFILFWRWQITSLIVSKITRGNKTRSILIFFYFDLWMIWFLPCEHRRHRFRCCRWHHHWFCLFLDNRTKLYILNEPLFSSAKRTLRSQSSIFITSQFLSLTNFRLTARFAMMTAKRTVFQPKKKQKKFLLLFILFL